MESRDEVVSTVIGHVIREINKNEGNADTPAESVTAKNEQAIITSANQLIQAFTLILKDNFERPIEDFPLRFAKFFVTVFQESCSCKVLMEEVNERELYEMTE